MQMNDARDLAVRLMTEHGLIAQGWRFEFDNAQRRLGQCNYTRKQITISRYMTGAANTDEVEQTLLHEIAHALTPIRDARGRKVGHGPEWKAKAREIGYRGGRTSENPYMRQRDQVAANMSGMVAAPADDNLSNGTRVFLRGRDLHGAVVGFGRARYKVRTDDGQFWTAAPQMLLVVEDEPASAPEAAVVSVPVAQRPARMPNGTPVLIRGRGLHGTVVGFGRTRYKVRTDDGQFWTAPAELLEPFAA